MSNVVIVGGGHAAAEASVTLRKNGWEGGICIVSEEAVAPYHRPPLSKGFVNGSVKDEQLQLKKSTLYEQHNIEIKLGARAVEIDRKQKYVELNTGECLHYSHLILATGTRPRKLKIPGTDLLNINYLRTIEDAKRIKELVRQDARLLVIGAGYIGLELAASASKMGAQVTVVEAQGRVLARVTSERVSEFYFDLHKAQGVEIRLNTGVTSIEKNNNCYQATLNDGTAIQFDAVVVGIGVIPNIELAEQCGLDCDNGVVVNNKTQTSDPCIFAIGDCSNHPNTFYQKRVRLESVPNALEQAKVAASLICGGTASHDALPWFWSDQYDVKIQTAGLSEGYEEAIIRGKPENKSFCVFYLKDRRIIAIDAVNSPADFIKSKAFILNKTPVSISVLENTSKPWFE